MGWITLIDEREYGIPPAGISVDRHHRMIEIAPPWDFDNARSRRRHEELVQATSDWLDDAYPKSALDRYQEFLNQQRISMQEETGADEGGDSEDEGAP
ncbi:MAG: hypothetical protein AAF715_23700 [Myxococcota bacterium]